MQLCNHFSQIPVVYFKEYLNEIEMEINIIKKKIFTKINLKIRVREKFYNISFFSRK